MFVSVQKSPRRIKRLEFFILFISRVASYMTSSS